MSADDLIRRYNYDSFVREKFEPWIRFDESPPVGEPSRDFPLWDLDGKETTLSAWWERSAWLVVEFGSFT